MPLIAASKASLTTYVGDRGDEIRRGIARDAAGFIYVTGSTTSPDLAADDSARTARAGDALDIFVAKLSPDGGELIYLTYVGGDGVDQAMAIAVDPGWVRLRDPAGPIPPISRRSVRSNLRSPRCSTPSS